MPGLCDEPGRGLYHCAGLLTPLGVYQSSSAIFTLTVPAPPERYGKSEIEGHIHLPQVHISDVEAYHYDGECIAKAEELGYPGLVTINQKQVLNPRAELQIVPISSYFLVP